MRHKVIIGVAVILSLGAGLYRYFGPNDPVRLSPATTHLTAPLAEDGLPNYALAMLQRQRAGVTSKNNGSPLLWQAMGPGELDPELFAVLCEDLEVNVGDPPQPTFLVDVASDETADRLARWIAEQGRTLADHDDATNQSLPSELLDVVAPYLQSIQSRPWTSEQLPPLGEWLAENNESLNLLVEASKKPSFFSPSPNVLLNPHTPVIDLTLEHAELARGAVRSLAARAMHRLAAGQHEAAWEDVHACWRFGQLIGNDRTIVELLVGVATRNVAANATLAILDANDLPKTTSRRISEDLNGLRESFDLGSSIDFYERLIFLDSALRHLSGRLGGIEDQALTTRQEKASVDLNIILERGNLAYDQLVEAVSIEDWQKRAAAIDEIDAEFNQRSKSLKSRMLFSFFSRSKRSEAMADILILMMIPATNAAVDAWERDQANLALTKMATALALYRMEHGEYPESLGVLEKSHAILVDPYTASPLIYERRDDGYLLYSLFKNRIDDGGLDLGHPIVDGEWVAEEEFVRPGTDSCDLVIRLPLPPLELPVVSSGGQN